MSKKKAKLNQRIAQLIRSHLLHVDSLFFNEWSGKEKQAFKLALLDRFILCRDASDPDKQREKITEFFREMDSFLAQEKYDEIMSPPSPSSSSDSSEENFITLTEFWSMVAASLLDDLQKHPEIHQGGFLRGRRASADHDSALLLAILHKQMFGSDLMTAGKMYPSAWPEWCDFMRGHLQILGDQLSLSDATAQQALWQQIFQCINKTIDRTDPLRSEKLIYQCFFNLINPFKTLVDTELGFRPFEVPLTLIKANPKAQGGNYDAKLSLVLYELLKPVLAPFAEVLVLPPVAAAVVAELKIKFAPKPIVISTVPGDLSSLLSETGRVSTYGSVNDAGQIKRPIVTACHGAMYAKVPDALHQADKPSANDECCACAIL